MQNLYKLNSKGINCYYRNQDMKNIPVDHLIILADNIGYNSGTAIYMVYSSENNKLKDYYFEDCLEVEYIRKIIY
jgi:hypothetical protein